MSFFILGSHQKFRVLWFDRGMASHLQLHLQLEGCATKDRPLLEDIWLLPSAGFFPKPPLQPWENYWPFPILFGDCTACGLPRLDHQQILFNLFQSEKNLEWLQVAPSWPKVQLSCIRLWLASFWCCCGPRTSPRWVRQGEPRCCHSHRFSCTCGRRFVEL